MLLIPCQQVFRIRDEVEEIPDISYDRRAKWTLFCSGDGLMRAEVSKFGLLESSQCCRWEAKICAIYEKDVEGN